MDEWLDKLWDTYRVEYFSVIRRTEALVGPASWMDQKGIILSKKDVDLQRLLTMSFQNTTTSK